MTRVKLIATACVTAIVMVLALGVAAQDFNTNERTYLTFSSSVELPGVTLQPGTYLFRLADSQSNRHIVQVFSQDEKQVHATILAVPAERLEVTGETVVTFRETAEGATPAVQYWYYPGDRIGHEFVYPKDQAMRIAKRTGQNVLSMEGDVASAGTTVHSTTPEGQVTEWKREDTPESTAQTGQVAGATGMSRERPQEETVSPSTETEDPETETPPAEPTTSAQAGQTRSGAMTESQDRPATSRDTVGTAGEARELPRTASPLPLSALIGLLSLGGAIALRRARS
jgi:hypothetical protein